MNTTSLLEREHRMVWKGPVSDFLLDPTRFVDMEGAIRSGKTTAALWKVFNSCMANPGINWLICRYSDDDTKTKLKPVWRKICYEAGVTPVWNAEGKYDELPNESRVYVFGLKAQDLTMRYAKFRGITLAGIYNDQTEELPYDVYEELSGRLSQPRQPHQILLTPNPPSEDHWLVQEFPEDNHRAHHKYFKVSIYDNAHNLPDETIPNLEVVYPVAHSKHGPMLLGARGINVMGQPVYGPLKPHMPETAAFQRSRHERPLEMDPTLALFEAIDFGKHHPCVVWAQYTPYSELLVLGGVMGMNMFLEDFAPIVQQYRKRWFPKALEVRTCCDPAGSHDNSQGLTQNGVKVLQDCGFNPVYEPDSNTPAVRLAMIERIAGAMRRRSSRGTEAFGIHTGRFVRISSQAMVDHKFLAQGCEAGYVWDQHMVSVGNKQVRKPKKDGWFEHGQNCLEYLEHNFGGVQPTLEQSARRAAAVHKREEQKLEVKDYYTELRRLNPSRRVQTGRRGGL